jgi:glycosyltransferase 2 family protein
VTDPTRRAWPTVKRGLTLAFFGLVVVLLYTQAREVDWSEVRTAMSRYSGTTVVLAVALAASSHALYGCFDQIGRVYTGHGLAPIRVATIAFVSYAFNLNLGSLIGGIGFRYRLYSKSGLDTGTIARVTGLSIAANWLGYLIVAGAVFAWGVVVVPPGWEIGSVGLQWIGAGLLVVAALYLLACALSTRRQWTVRGHELVLPSFRMAALQAVIAAVNWLLIAALIHVLLRQQVPYPTVLAVFLLSAIAGVIAHVPAGLGVIEVVFFTMLGHLVPRTELIAALLSYRAFYYLGPLMIALALYVRLEARASAKPPATATA